jgi:hypothetical protein
MTTAALPTSEMFEQLTNRAVEGLSIWADANQKVLRQLVDLSTVTASETVRVYTELQSSALTAVRASQELLVTQQGTLQNVQKDPFGAYQKGIAESVNGAQQVFKLAEVSAETVTRSAERIQESAEKVTRDIQATFVTTATKLKTLYAPIEVKQ